MLNYSLHLILGLPNGRRFVYLYSNIFLPDSHTAYMRCPLSLVNFIPSKKFAVTSCYPISLSLT